MLRADGVSTRYSMEGSHSFSIGSDWRFVWGGQYRKEQVDSPDLFMVAKNHQFNVQRVFGSAEWRPHPQWIVNFGGLSERHSIIGNNSAPRAMVNFHVLPGHTLRIGESHAYKLPTLFELRADWFGAFQPTGKIRAEQIKSTELGYLGKIRPLNLTVDIRAFQEKVRDLIGESGGDMINKDPNTQRGWETQLRWQPTQDTLVWLNHTQLRLMPGAESTVSATQPYRAPKHFSTLALFQRLPQDFDLSVIHTTSESYFVVRKSDMIPGFRQTDLRLAKNFRIGTTRAEAAFFVRAMSGGHVDYVLRGIPQVFLNHRIHTTLRLDF